MGGSNQRDNRSMESGGCAEWYHEEFKKPLDEIKEDIFFRADNFRHEAWYGDLLMYTRIGVCQPRPEHMPELQKALKILGYPTHKAERNGKAYLAPGERQSRKNVQKNPHSREER